MSKYTIGPLFDKSYPVTQFYGANPDYYKQFGLPGHEGVDYGTPSGTEFLSPFNGVILRDTFGDKDYGNFTVVWDPIQLCAVWFCHLQDVTTQAGDKVVKGQVLGHTDNTGNTSGPHCHINFVETDSLGNRLNKSNAYQGFMNILDPDLVTIENPAIITQPTTQPGTEIAITEQTKIPQISNMEVQAIRSTLTDQQATINSLTHGLATANADLLTAKNVISQLQNQVSSLQAQIPPPPPPLPPQTPLDSQPSRKKSFWTRLVEFLGL